MCIVNDIDKLMHANEHSDQKLDLLFVLRFYISVNSYGHVGRVSSPNHTFFLCKLDEPVLRLHTFACNWQQPFLNQQEENDRINYFVINLHENMGQDQTRNFWICCQTRYQLRYGTFKIALLDMSAWANWRLYKYVISTIVRFLIKDAVKIQKVESWPTVLPAKSDSDVVFCLQLLS